MIQKIAYLLLASITIGFSINSEPDNGIYSFTQFNFRLALIVLIVGALICILYKNRFRITNEEVAVFAVIILILALIYNIFECTIPPIIPAFVLECIGEGYLKKISKSSEDEDERGPQY